jgi:hypothetical protein
MSAVINLPHHLQSRLQLPNLQANGSTFFTCLKNLCIQHPTLTPYCFTTDNQLSGATVFYLNGRDIREFLRDDPDPVVNDDDVIEIEPSIVGG